MYSLKYFISIGIDIKVHFLIIMGGKLIGIISEHVINSIIIFKIACFSWYNMYHKVFDWGLLCGVLDVYCCGSDIIVALQGFGHEAYSKAKIEHLNRLQLTELFNSSFCRQ